MSSSRFLYIRMENLRREWQDARKHVKQMADEEHDKFQEQLEQTKAEFQTRWEALETAVDAYRKEIDQAGKSAQS